MKHAYLLGLISLLTFGAQAHNFCPVQPGLLHQYTLAVGDSSCGVWLEKVGDRFAADSLYTFRPRLGGASFSGVGSCRTRYAATLFGSNIRVRRAGTFQVEYTLRIGTPASAQSMLLRPYAALNQPWQATTRLTAQVTARTTALVLGQPDSVLTITFSNGQTLRLAKQAGLVAGPAPLDLIRNTATIRTLTLTALPTQRRGNLRMGPWVMFDFQPGDVFYYRNDQHDFMQSVVTQYADSVMSRSTSRTGDTLTYRIWNCGPPPARGGAYTLLVSSRTHPLLLRNTGEFVPNTPDRQRGVWIGDVTTTRAAWPAGRFRQEFKDRHQWCGSFTAPDSTVIQGPYGDGERYYSYGQGLGQTNFAEINTTCCYTFTDLIGYHKGAERWGTSFPLCRPLAAQASQAAPRSTTSPNPCQDKLTLHCLLRQPQALRLTFHDALGRAIQVPAGPVLPAGPQQVEVSTAALAPGSYTLHLEFPAEGRTEVLKVQRLP